MTAALSFVPQQGGELTLTNVRPTYGVLGAKRKDADAPKLLPGDVFCLSFDINGLKVAPDGLVQYSIGMELTRDGKVQLGEKPEERTSYNSLGGTGQPAFVATQLGTDTQPGKYALTAIVVDRANKNATQKVTREFQVLPKKFGLVRLSLHYPGQGGLIPAPPFGVPGQSLLVGFAAAGFQRDKKTEMPHVTAKMRVLENGKSVLEKDVSGAAKDAPPNFSLIPLSFLLNLNRAGKFTVEITVTDELTSPKKTATESFEIVVHDLKTK
jgi:hypothetical protein